MGSSAANGAAVHNLSRIAANARGIVFASLPPDWYVFTVRPGVDRSKPGIYKWRIEGVGSYIGKFKRIRRPTREYGRNVSRLLNGRAYRLGNPDGFRRIHRELEQAHREGRRIELIILENVEPDAINARELVMIRTCGNLNVPPYAGQRISD